jgi:hypothetical protein
LSWQSFSTGPDGPKRVASLEKAIAKMKSLDSARGSTDPQRQKDYMRSWEYWANIHGFFGPDSMNGPIAAYVASLQGQVPQVVIDSFNGLQDQTVPADGVASKVWGTCQHSHSGSDGKLVQANFWGWHRIYLYYFEKVLRWAAEDDTLNLPYWDYTNVNHLVLPAPYQNSHTSLFEPKRAIGYNSGGKLPADDTDADSALGMGAYLDAELAVETGVHGNVHCDVGGAANGCPQALMGKVPVAANDPIFYSHHANIDRLWACWQGIHGAPAQGDWMNQDFSFPDETGTLQTRKVSEFLKTEARGYRYEQTSNCLRHPAPEAVRTAAIEGQNNENAAAAEPTILGSAAAVKLTQATTQVKISVPRVPMLAAQKMGAPVATKLVLSQVSAKVPPGPVLRVYVEVTGKRALRKLVGSINWFAEFEHEGGPSVRDLTFDITNAVHALGEPASGLTVTFQASKGVDMPTTKALKSTAATGTPFNPAADLTVGSIQIEQVPKTQ